MGGLSIFAQKMPEPLGGVASGVYPGVMNLHIRDLTGAQKWLDNSATQGYFIPQNFITASQTLIDATTTQLQNLLSKGNHLLNDQETLKYRIGEGWGGYKRLVTLNIAPIGKASVTLTNRPTASACVVKLVILSSTKFALVWTVPGATNCSFYCKVGTLGAGGITWGAETQIGSIAATNANGAESKWTAVKQATDKIIVYFSEAADSNYLSASCFAVTGTAVGAPGATARLEASASPTIWCAAYTAADKSTVFTNIANAKAYCNTTSTVTITAGSGTQVTSGTINTKIMASYISDDFLLISYALGAASGGTRTLSISTRTISLNTESSSISLGNSPVPTPFEHAKMSATKFAQRWYSNFNYQYVYVAISGTDVTATVCNDSPLSQSTAEAVLTGDATNAEAWAIGYTSRLSFYKFNTLALTKMMKGGAAQYTANSTHVALEFIVSSSAYNPMDRCGELGGGLSMYICGYETAATGVVTIQVVGAIKVNVSINGTSVHTAGALSNGAALQLLTDISVGYAEIAITNNAGAFSAFMPDQALILAT